MNIYDLTVNQLKRAVAIKEQIENLNRDLDRLGSSNNSGIASPKSRPMSASAKRKSAAAQKARRAKFRGANPVTHSAPKKKTSPAPRAKLSDKVKAYGAAKKI